MGPGLVLLLLLAAHQAVAGAPPLQRHEFTELQAYYQNREVHPGTDGEVWVANPSGLLRFDRTRWSIADTRDSLLALARDEAGGACAGVGTGLGRFEPLPDGGLAYVDLQVEQPVPVASTLAVLRHASGCSFITPNAALRRGDDGQWQALAFEAAVDAVPGLAWPPVLRQGGSLQRLRWDGQALSLEEVASEALGQDLVAWIDLEPGQALLVYADGRLLRWREGRTEAFAAHLWPELERLRPSAALRSGDGRIALGLTRGGLWMLDAQGELVEAYGEAQGLPELRVNHLAEDAAGGLWLAQMRYVVRIDRGSGLTRFDRHLGAPDATAFAQHRGVLLAGSSAGLLRLHQPPLPQSARFEPVEAGLGTVLDLLDHAGWLWVAHTDGLDRLQLGADGTVTARQQLIAQGPVRDLQRARHAPDRIYVAARGGVARIDEAAAAAPVLTWIATALPAARVVDEGATRLWFTTGPRRFVALDWGDGEVVQREHDMDAVGLSGLIAVFPAADGGVWFTGSRGLLRFDAEAQAFAPHPALAGSEAPETPIAQLLEDAEGHLWARGGGFTGALWREGDRYRRDNTVLRALDARPTVHAFARFGDALWIGRSDGALRLDLARRQPAPAAVAPRLAGIVDTRSQTRLPLPSQALRLDAAGANLRFDFALPQAGDSARVLFRSRLRGFDAEFEAWSRNGERSYTNLPHGDFAFELQALDPWGRETAMEPLPLRVKAPWFLRPAGIGGLAALGLLTLWGSGRVGASWRARRLLQRQRELEQEVAQRTAELAERNAQLQEQAQRLREVERLKSRLFDNVSHEFRTPLTLVLGPLDDLLGDARLRLSERARELLEMASRNARKVLDLIVELMDLNRIEQGQLPMRPQRLAPAAFLRRQLEDLQALAERYGHQLQAGIELPESLQAEFDPLQIERVLNNLVGNAAKYTARGGRIALCARLQGSDPEWIELQVTDDGPGIAPEVLPHVFDRFFQASVSASGDGAGIGLALVREIVEAHGGRIGVESRLGQGSRFAIQLPLRQASSVPDAACAAAIAPQALDVDAAMASPTAAADGGEAEDARPLLLLIDDHDELRARLRGLLGQRYRLCEAADGEPGLDLARRELPDLIVCDVMMPGMDGLQLARRLRADPDTAAIPLLLLTARAGADRAVAGLAAGADDYLAKPFDAGELQARLDALLARRRRLLHALQREREVAPLPPSAEERWRERLDGVIEARLDDSSFGVDALAAAMHSDRTTLFRRLKAQLGLSPSELIREARLRRAHALLGSGAGNVTEVAYAVGFESLSSFARAFRNRYGCAPSALIPESDIAGGGRA